ncbi:deoxyribonuclease IV [Paenibacillus segetis]|uniref:Endonuclease 4 n=1 Tax=Paenibacillus segetis TaxID=1325360 RepID=A0ABQ1YFR9_9BACL|nr:deoxyribonuclease IV [Paenibacillus segetis]GGH22770.1 putative endonuclease 4 [Paenibacillus segetis]
MTVELKIGGHHSIRAGFYGAAKQSLLQGETAFQYFPKNPRSLTVKEFDPFDARKCRELCEEHGLVSIAHTPYPTNLAVGRHIEGSHFERTVNSLRNDLEIAEACGSLGIVVHFGTNKDLNPLQGYQNIIQCINEVLSGWNGSAKLLIENQAGDHGDMGMTMEELVKIRSLCQSPELIGYCLDTCHAFASGMWTGEQDNNFAVKAKDLDFWEGLISLHLNDSKYPVHSRKDRHARVGQGYIGESGFRHLLQIEELQDTPMILESGTGEDGTYREDIRLVKRWIET